MAILETYLQKHVIYWSISGMYCILGIKENIRKFRRFWNDCKCFLATIFYLLTKNVHCRFTQLPQSFDHTVLIFQMWKELRLPDLASWSVQWNSTTLYVNQRARMPNKVKANRETGLSKCRKARVHHTQYMATPEEKQIDTHSKMEWQMYLVSGNLPRVNPVVMNYIIILRNIGQRRGQQGIVLRGQTAFSVIILWWQKNGKTWSGHARLRTRVAMEEGLLSVWVSQSIGQSPSVDGYCYLLNSGFARTRSQILCS